MSEAEAGKRVLAYLREMIDLCRNFHRPDLVKDYTDAWEYAASKIYGPLPPLKASSINYAAPQPRPPAASLWKQQMLAKPYRKILRRFAAIEDGCTFEYEQLECGHRVPAGVDLPDTPPAKRRRCAECAREASQDPTTQPRPGEPKAVASSNSARWYPSQGEKTRRESADRSPGLNKAAASVKPRGKEASA